MAKTENNTTFRPTFSLKETRRFYRTAIVALTALIIYAIYQGWHLPMGQLSVGTAIILLAAWPALKWLKNQPYQFPAFETFMLTSITAYAMPLMTEHTVLNNYDAGVIMRATMQVLLFQVAALLAFNGTKAFPRKTSFWNASLFTRDVSAWLPIGMWLNLAYILVGRFTDLLAPDIDSVLRAVFFGINISCSFLLGRKWGEGRMTLSEKINIGSALVIQAIVMMSSLYLIAAISNVMVFLLAYVSGGKRLPFFALAAIFVVLSVLHNGKAQMRKKYWGPDQTAITLSQLPAFYEEWIEYGTRPFNKDDDRGEGQQLLERASLLHMLCLVLDSTDHGLPFMSGETYGHVPAQLVPRLLWPDKPTGQITSMRLGIYFGLQDENSALHTSIAFGEIAEAYANFGTMGVILLGVLIGWANKKIAIWTQNSPMISNGGFIMILLMAWSLQIELPMSNWVASFYQAAICVLGIPFILRRILN